jgi:hypothetical protein
VHQLRAMGQSARPPAGDDPVQGRMALHPARRLAGDIAAGSAVRAECHAPLPWRSNQRCGTLQARRHAQRLGSMPTRSPRRDG